MANKIYKTGRSVELLRKKQRTCANCYFNKEVHPKIKIYNNKSCLKRHLKGMKLPICISSFSSYIFIKKSK